MPRAGGTDWILLVGGAAIGMLAGGVVWLLDASPPAEMRRASPIGSVLAVLALFPGCLPFVGLVFGVPAFVINRRAVGWQNRASRFGLGLNVVMTVITVVAMQLSRT